MSLCTRAQVKSFLEIASADTDHDAQLDMLIAGVSTQLARLAGRISGGAACLEKGSLVQYFSPPRRTAALWLPAYPVVSISEIKEAMYEGWSDATALTANTDYQIDLGTGQLNRVGYWLPGMRTVKVTCIGGYRPADVVVTGPLEPDATGYYNAAGTNDVQVYYSRTDGSYHIWYDLAGDEWIISDEVGGGTEAGDNYWDGADEAAGSFAAAGAATGAATGDDDGTRLPTDITDVAIKQVAFGFQRRNKLGVASAGTQGGSFNAYARDELLPEVDDTMDNYARKMG